MRGIPLEERFMAKVDVQPNGCWQWTGYCRGGNYRVYGTFRAFGKMRIAHRVAYELFVGPIPAGLVIDHLCRNPGCVNPEHLEVVTQRENTLRGNTLQAKNARKTHCDYGHEFTDANTYRDPQGGRECRTCRLNRQRTDRHYR